MPERFELFAQGLETLLRFELHRTEPGQIVRRSNGLLHIEPEIEHTDNRLNHIANDARTAGRANNESDSVVFIKHDGRRHAA